MNLLLESDTVECVDCYESAGLMNDLLEYRSVHARTKASCEGCGKAYMKTATIIVDFQRDFYDGTLSVPDAAETIQPIVDLASQTDLVAFTADWHPYDHMSFSDNPQYVDKSWPVHCVAGEPGSEIHKGLRAAFHTAPVFYKGMDKDVEQYSGAEGVSEDDETLIKWLDDNGVTHVYVVGLALDYCVKNTAIDIALADVTGQVDTSPVTTVVTEGTRPVAYVTGTKAVVDMLMGGVNVLPLDSVIEALDEAAGLS